MERDEMLAILSAVAQAPDTVTLLFASAAVRDSPSARTSPPTLTTQRLQARAEELLEQIVALDGNTNVLRQHLVAESPSYERAIPASGKPNPAVFSRLNPVAMNRLSQLYS